MTLALRFGCVSSAHAPIMLLQVVPASVPLLRPNRHHPRFDLIVTDVDGTLLDSSHTLRDDVRRALLRARELGVPCCLATGKTRGAVAEAADAVAKGMPGVYSQGLDVRAADGFSIWTGVLEPALAAESARLGAALGLSVLAFCGADMLCTARNAQTDRLLAYGESCPITAAERGFKDLPEVCRAPLRTSALHAHRRTCTGPAHAPLLCSSGCGRSGDLIRPALGSRAAVGH